MSKASSGRNRQSTAWGEYFRSCKGPGAPDEGDSGSEALRVVGANGDPSEFLTSR